jgi:ABC-2 type transport system permease protein/lipopolysaccharide transport system permease protein
MYVDGFDDLRSAWSKRGSWWLLARQSIQGSYRRTVLGPFWITIQQLVWVLGIGVVYSQLFHVNRSGFIPLLAYGVLIWSLISGVITSAPSLFSDSAAYLASSTLPISFYLYQSLAVQALTFLHSAVVMVLIPIMYGVVPTVAAIGLVPLALTLILVNSVFAMLWLAPLGLRYRDVRVAVSAITPLMMFMTPIFWDPTQLRNRHWIVLLNPMAWPVVSMRDPLLGHPADRSLWVLFLAATLLNGAFGLVVFSRSRARLRYWI